MPIIRLALAQINPTVGDLSGNAARISEFARRAGDRGAGLVVFPELALSGYPPEDLLFQPRFVRDVQSTLSGIAKDLPTGLAAIVGFPEGLPGRLANAAAVLSRRKVLGVYRKKHLPNYGVFDEERYFQPGEKPLVLNVAGALVGVTICEDIWVERGPALSEAEAGAQLIVNLSASPFHAGKLTERIRILKDRVRECGAFFAYCNTVGGQDELVFDGASVVMDRRGRVLAQAPQFEEHLLLADLPLPETRRAGRTEARPPVPIVKAERLPENEEVYNALVLGTRDYVRKNGFQKAVLGLSGGIDSSLVACLAADALGKENVVGITMPSRFSSPGTRSDAERLARNLGIEFHALPIEEIVEAFLKTLAPVFAGKPRDVTEENLQARVRGTLLMALSNKFGCLVLTTG
ncbi:MAG: NAD+ synthase, partial [Elusimicrobia bacterium]|nr:NAD+ synthase [Elusimicrobiota bacterium]